MTLSRFLGHGRAGCDRLRPPGGPAGADRPYHADAAGLMVHSEGAHGARRAAPTGFEPVPSGDYRARIVGAAIGNVSRSRNYGRCLTLTWQIETGPFGNRLISQRLNLWAENMRNLDKVITIANAQFAAIRAATGRPVPREVDDLRNIACRIKVGIASDPSGQYAPRNEVRAVRAAGGVADMPR